MDLAQFIAYLRALVEQQGTMRQWADDHGVSWQYVSNVIHGHRPPGVKLLHAMGYHRVVIYRPILDVRARE